MHSPHIMLIDDNQALREAMVTMLRLSDYEVTERDHLKEIFDEERLPDIYIIDYWLKDIQGSSVCSILKTNTNTRNIPVIIMSGDSAIESEVYNVGADAFLRKPFSMKQMLTMVSDLLYPLNFSVFEKT